jgi:hypothetical protein
MMTTTVLSPKVMADCLFLLGMRSEHRWSAPNHDLYVVLQCCLGTREQKLRRCGISHSLYTTGVEVTYFAAKALTFRDHEASQQNNQQPRSWDRAVRIATGCGLGDRGVGVRVPVASRIFSASFRPALESTQPPIQWVPEALPRR